MQTTDFFSRHLEFGNANNSRSFDGTFQPILTKIIQAIKRLEDELL